LHVHSQYSLLDGLPKIDLLLDRVEELGMDSIAITDHGNMYGAIEFYKKAKARGIKPIIGCEFYTAYERLEQKRPNIDNKRYHLILLAKNEIGYKNLVQLVSKAHLDGFYYKPRIDDVLLAKHSEGLICSTACLAGRIPRLITAKQFEKAEELALKYQQMFGKDNFYLEIQHHPHLSDQAPVNEALIAMSKKYGIPLIATNDSHYLRKEDAEAQDILMLINTGSDPNDPERATIKADDFSLKSGEEMAEIFKDTPQAIENTQKIAEMCNLELELEKTKLPKFEVPTGKTPDSYLREICEAGLERRYGKAPTREVLERLDYELSVITETGFASYFLIVQDFVSWARGQRIVVGPGRGSAAGSIVAYLTRVTNVDPIKNNLLFERFLNPERISMPDIDLDFTDRRRDEVIEYVGEKYGKDKVAQIITFGTMAARAAIRDVGRALRYEYSYCDMTAKMIPLGFTLDETLEKVTEFRNFYESDDKAKTLIDIAKKLEGVVRHASTHACGVVVSDRPLTDSIPLQKSSSQDKENIVTQYEMHSVESMGLLKMDFLGLKNLTIIEDTLSRIYVLRDGLKIDIDEISLDDPETIKLFQKAETTSVFQLESDGIKRYLKELKPTEFEDIVAILALYRPGPMQFIPEYIARKHKKKEVSYLHPKLKPILEKTQGICIYQEQLMQIARDIAGFSLAEADVLRKAVGKKIEKLLNEQEVKFIEGAVNNGVEKRIAIKLWQWILPFAQYGFNKSHSAAYATIAFQTAYLKAHYPVEFMGAVLTSEKMDVDRIAFLIDECKRMKIEVLPPNINESLRNFTVVQGENKIRFGLIAIKNVGENVIDVITTERKNGKFKSINDFLKRVDSKDLNKKSMDSLIKSGAFDEFEERNSLLHNMERLLLWSKEHQKNKINGQAGLFEATGFDENIYLEPAIQATSFERLSWEKDLLGLYVTAHPLDDYKDLFKGRVTELSKLKGIYMGQQVTVGGVISTVKKIITKKGQPMLFVKLEDLTTKAEIVVFPNMLEQNPTAFEENKIVLISGRVDHRDNEPKIIANEIEEVINQG
ncbi:DNA polymerase III subunit alpha, partial [Patescibacteria group bacterium]|nr:DNA polymerase III subunit alpha [Patescibacteria group bacterium]